MSNGRFDFNRGAIKPGECLREGWQTIRDEYWLILGIVFVGQLIAGIGPMGILMGPMVCGIDLCLLRKASGRRISFDMLFRGFDYFVKSLIATLIIFVPLMLILGLLYVLLIAGFFVTVANNPGAGPPPVWVFPTIIGVWAIGIFSLLFLVEFLFIFTYPLIVDRELSGSEAVLLSIRAALGNFGGLVGLILLYGAMTFAGLLACYVGAIFVLPLVHAMKMVAYRQVFPSENSLRGLLTDEENDDDFGPTRHESPELIQGIEPSR